MSELTIYSKEISSLCKKHGVKSLYAFGSVLSGNYDEDSDIDFVVEFENIKLEDYADNYFDFKFSLQGILKRPIDLLEEKAIRNPFFRQVVDQQKQLVYGQ